MKPCFFSQPSLSNYQLHGFHSFIFSKHFQGYGGSKVPPGDTVVRQEYNLDGTPVNCKHKFIHTWDNLLV